MSHHAEESINDPRPARDGFPFELERVRNLALLVGLVGLALMLLSLLGNPQHAFRSYLFGYVYWLAVPCGCLFFVMMSHLTGGEYAVVYRRFGEAAFMTLPVMLVLWLPLMLGMRYLFPWMHIGDFTGASGNVEFAQAMVHRAKLFNPPVFIIRNLCYFVILIGLAFGMRNMSLKLDAGDDPYLRLRIRRLAAPGIILYFLVVTAFAIDYLMSRETNWYSSMIGFIFAIGQGAAGMAFMSLSVCYFANRRPIRDVVRPQHLNDFGNLLLAVTVLWMYTSFAQFLVIWQGNTQADVGYYVHRGLGPVPNGWRWVALSLFFLNFGLPFLLLLMKNLKRKINTLALICVIILIMRIVDYLWLIAPSGPHRGKFEGGTSAGQIYWTDPIAWLGVGGIFIATYLWNLARHPILPQNAADQPALIVHGAAGHGASGHGPGGHAASPGF